MKLVQDRELMVNHTGDSSIKPSAPESIEDIRKKQNTLASISCREKMATPTLQDIASWPAPNYVNPHTRTSLVLGIEIPFTLVTVTIVTARMVAPLFTRRTLGAEDWLMAFATVRHKFDCM
jgi:hypothetical protein